MSWWGLLGGGLNNFFIYVHPNWEMIQFDFCIFFRWVLKNHQLVFFSKFFPAQEPWKYLVVKADEMVLRPRYVADEVRPGKL